MSAPIIAVVVVLWLLAFVHLRFPRHMSRLSIRMHAKINGPDRSARLLMGPRQMRNAGVFLAALAVIMTALALNGTIR